MTSSLIAGPPYYIFLTLLFILFVEPFFTHGCFINTVSSLFSATFPPDYRLPTKPNRFISLFILLYQDIIDMESIIYEFFSYGATIATSESINSSMQNFTSDWAPGQ